MDDKEFWRSEKVAFLALSLIKGVGFWTMHKIAESGSSFKDALRNLDKFDANEKGTPETISSSSQIELWQAGLNLARNLAANKIQLYLSEEPDFPLKLKEIHDAPKWIFVQGSIDNLSKPAASIVGTRKPSEDGLFLTKFAVACLANISCVTVSGLALGIDQVTHLESLRYGIPTVAVLGTGILQNYPKGSEPLRQNILDAGGTIISEYLPHQSYSAENFVRRNRLQAALGEVLIPTQWEIKSGTAHTVKFAAKNGKLIINLHLPRTLEKRPEILFSISEYGAIPFEIPGQTDELINLIKARAFGIFDHSTSLDTDTSPIPEPEEIYTGIADGKTESEATDQKTDRDTSTKQITENNPDQLSLI